MMDSQTTGRVTLCPDGKYRWAYEVNLFKNASTFYDVVKVIGLTLGLVYGMMLIMGIFVADDWSVVWTMTLAFFCIALGLCLLCLIIYWIWAAANGGRYAALFEMDEHGITHSQMQKHVRQQQIVSSIGVAVGLATGKPGVIGNSLLAASVNEWKSNFASVRKVKAVPHRNLIKVSELAQEVGTNRTYLRQYFSSQGTTYNAYINKLRIDHFIELYHEASATAEGQSIQAKQLAARSGYRSYSTFSLAFKQRMGVSVTAWMRAKGR